MAGSTRRGEGGWKFKPIQWAPAEPQATASATVVRPQTLTSGVKLAPAIGSRHAQLAQGVLVLRLRADAHESGDDFAILDDHNGRNPGDPELAGGRGVLV